MASQTTTDHDQIRAWAEARGGRPTRVKGADAGGILRIDFGKPEDSLEEMSWDEFFEIFDDRRLALIVQDETANGKQSRFSKFVNRI